MHISDPVIERAFASCPLPSEVNSSAFEEYLQIIDIIGKDLYELRKSISPEQFDVVARCLETLQIQENSLSYYYFERGWLAAKEDNAHEHF